MKLSSVIVSVILIIGMCCDFILAERSTVSISPLNNKKDIKPAESINQRDPAPEFYRGSSYDRDRYSSVIGRNGYETDKNNFVTSPGGSRFTPSAPGPTQAPFNNRDRIPNDGPYNTGSRYGGGYGSGYNSNTGPTSTGNGYGYLPGGTYEPTPYGPPQPVDPTYNLIPGGGYENGYDGGYGSHHGDGGHHGHDLTKKVLLPLAGAAILGVAAALVANPVLLQLGVTSAGKRKRRDIDGNEEAQKLAYKRQHYTN